jgi:hypothetical protein
MLLPVHPSFGTLAARTVEFALAAFFAAAITIPRVAVAIPPRAVEFRTILAIELRPLAEWPVALHAILARTRKPWALVATAIVAGTVKARLVEPRPRAAILAVATFALLPRLGFAARRPIAEILARPIAELAIGEPSFAALAARRTISTIESRTVATIKLRAISAGLEVPLLATFTIKPRRARSVAEFSVRETAFAALATRRTVAVKLRAIATVEFRAISAGLEIPLLATGAIVAVEARRARPVAIVPAGRSIVIPAAWRTVIAVAGIGALAAFALAKPALGELFLRAAGGAGAALTGRPITPAAGIVVFVAVAGHEGSRRIHFRADQEAIMRARLSGRILTQNRYPLLLKAQLVAGFFR